MVSSRPGVNDHALRPLVSAPTTTVPLAAWVMNRRPMSFAAAPAAECGGREVARLAVERPHPREVGTLRGRQPRDQEQPRYRTYASRTVHARPPAPGPQVSLVPSAPFRKRTIIGAATNWRGFDRRPAIGRWTVVPPTTPSAGRPGPLLASLIRRADSARDRPPRNPGGRRVGPARDPRALLGLPRVPPPAAGSDRGQPAGPRQRRRAAHGRRQVAVLPDAGPRRAPRRGGPRRVSPHLADEGPGRRSSWPAGCRPAAASMHSNLAEDERRRGPRGSSHEGRVPPPVRLPRAARG